MDGANKTFLANPRLFINQNVIVIREGRFSDTVGECLLDLRADQDQATDESGHNLGVYSVVPLASKTTCGNQFKGYFLPWGTGKTYMQTLDKKGVNFFFTPGLTGCTFTWSSGTKPTVAHFNYVSGENDTIDQPKIDRKAAKKYGDTAFERFTKSDYKDAEERFVFIIGWREASGWQFFAQHLLWSGIQGGARIWTRDKPVSKLGFSEAL